MTMKMWQGIVLFSFILLSLKSWSEVSLKEIFLQPDLKKIQETLSLTDLSKLSEQDRKLYDFAQGYYYFTDEKWSLSQKALESFVQTKNELSPYAYYYLGLLAQKKADHSQAKAYFLKAINLPIQRSLKSKIRYELGRSRTALKQYRYAYKDYKYVERKWRGTPEHPQVLWNLVGVEIQLNRSWRSCRWMKKIYKKYPGYEKANSWGIFLKNNNYNGHRLHCLSSFKDKRQRIRRLQWAGLSDKARKEIQEFSNSRSHYTDYDKKSMLAEFLLHEGFVNEGLKLLLPFYNEQVKSYNYQQLLAKAFSYNGKAQKAIGAFYRAYRLTPRSRYGRKALFQAAFLSYQNQDYDGAIRKFDEFLKKFRRSGLRRDVMWYRAWASYLKQDYATTLASLKYIKRQKLRRRSRRYWRHFPLEKINYWMAMSYLKLEKYENARMLFNELKSDQLLGYYGLLAGYRSKIIQPILLTLKNKTIERVPAEVTPEEEELEGFVTKSEEEESEENIEKEEDEEQVNEIVDEVDDKSFERLGKELESAKNKKIQVYYNRAEDLIYLGLSQFVKWELYEIERRTSRKEHLNPLMDNYNRVGAFNRSAYIAQIYFGSQRKKYGINGVRYLWESTYPKAYDASVSEYSKKFNIPKEFIWSIIRAESTYKRDVVSPVGAKGLMQLMPNTGRQVARLMGEEDFKEESLLVPKTNIKLGSRYLKRLANMMDYQWPLVAAGYNAGPHRVSLWLKNFGALEFDAFVEHIPYSETRKYVKKVIRYYTMYNKLYVSKESTVSSFMVGPIQRNDIKAPHFRETWGEL